MRSLIIIGVLILALSFQTTASDVMAQCCGSPAADQNCDGVVNANDLALVESRWGLTMEDPGFDPAYDLNGDGEIDLVDVEYVLRFMGAT